jgi:hypothetical protein
MSVVGSGIAAKSSPIGMSPIVAPAIAIPVSKAWSFTFTTPN